MLSEICSSTRAQKRLAPFLVTKIAGSLLLKAKMWGKFSLTKYSQYFPLSPSQMYSITYLIDVRLGTKGSDLEHIVY